MAEFVCDWCGKCCSEFWGIHHDRTPAERSGTIIAGMAITMIFLVHVDPEYARRLPMTLPDQKSGISPPGRINPAVPAEESRRVTELSARSIQPGPRYAGISAATACSSITAKGPSAGGSSGKMKSGQRMIRSRTTLEGTGIGISPIPRTDTRLAWTKKLLGSSSSTDITQNPVE